MAFSFRGFQAADNKGESPVFFGNNNNGRKEGGTWRIYDFSYDMMRSLVVFHVYRSKIPTSIT